MNSFARDLSSWLDASPRARVDGSDVPIETLAGRAAAVAAQLAELGVQGGTAVATLMDTSTAAVASWFGSAVLGCLEVPINTHYRGDLLTYLLRDSGSQVVICDATHLGDLLAAIPGTTVQHVLVEGPVDQSLPVLPGVEIHELAVSGSADTLFTRSADDAAGVVLYTSGTTGPSKGVWHTQESALELARAVGRLNDYGSSDTLLNFFPLYHQNARYTGVAAAIVSGAGFQLDRNFSSSRFWDICRAGNITAFNYLGSVLGMVLKASQGLSDEQARDHLVRLAWGAGAPREIWGPFEARFGLSITEVYGLTEAPMATVNRSSDPSPIGSAGREGDLFEVQVASPDGSPLPAGEVGEIRLRPKRPGIFMKGYLGREADTVAATRDLWFATGDSGHLNENGDLFFADRIKDAIRRKGENISAWEVESVLLSHPDVMECAVYAVRPEGAEDDEVMAAVVLKGETTGAELIAAIEHRLPRYAIPRFVRVLPALPRTSTQKVEKAQLRSNGVTGEVTDLRRNERSRPGTGDKHLEKSGE